MGIVWKINFNSEDKDKIHWVTIDIKREMEKEFYREMNKRLNGGTK